MNLSDENSFYKAQLIKIKKELQKIRDILYNEGSSPSSGSVAIARVKLEKVIRKLPNEES